MNFQMEMHAEHIWPAALDFDWEVKVSDRL